jgi:hypothetical protein
MCACAWMPAAVRPIFSAKDVIILMIHSFNLQVVRLLLLFSRKDVRMRLDASGSAPIFCAIEAGNLNVSRELLSVSPEEQVLCILSPPPSCQDFVLLTAKV